MYGFQYKMAKELNPNRRDGRGFSRLTKEREITLIEFKHNEKKTRRPELTVYSVGEIGRHFDEGRGG